MDESKTLTYGAFCLATTWQEAIGQLKVAFLENVLCKSTDTADFQNEQHC